MNLTINNISGSNISEDETEILQKIVLAEAGGEDLTGQILVANVILNRVKSSKFPRTIKEVVFAKNQFEPIRNGFFDKAFPTESVKYAVEAALTGADFSKGSLYFRSKRGYEGSWHEKKLKFLFEHGGHRFYV